MADADDAALIYAAQMIRADHGDAFGLRWDSPLDDWKDLVSDIIYSLRRAGWTVIPAEATS